MWGVVHISISSGQRKRGKHGGPLWRMSPLLSSSLGRVAVYHTGEVLSKSDFRVLVVCKESWSVLPVNTSQVEVEGIQGQGLQVWAGGQCEIDVLGVFGDGIGQGEDVLDLVVDFLS